MSTISASTTTTTAYKVTADTTGTLVLQTGSTPTTAVTIDASQNVGIGTSNPGDKLVVGATSSGSVITLARLLNAGTATGTASRLLFTNNTDGAGGSVSAAISHIAENTAGAGALAFYTPATGSPVERARIDSSGSLQVGTTTTNSARLSIFGGTGSLTSGIAVQNGGGSGNYFIQFFNSSGSGVGSISQNGASATAFNTSSDYRLKENIAPMTGALSVVQQLKPCTYTWKADGSNGQGFIAHELAEIVPDAVTVEKDAVNADGSIKSQGIDTSFLVATLTAAIQELKAELDAAKADIATLKGAA